VKIVAFVPDLMDRSRFPSDAGVTFVRSPDDITDDGDLIIVDLNRAGAFEAVKNINEIRRIGFTNHENTELIQQANAAGIETMARSRFFANVAKIVAG
jgi:hypothetical protein